jgi:hypothetical protein
VKYLYIAILFVPVFFTGCVEIGDSDSDPIGGEIVEQRPLTDEETAVWIDQAECVERESKSRQDIPDLDAAEVPIVSEITIRNDLKCGDAPPDTLVACQSRDEIAFQNGLDHDTFLMALRHEEIHFILFFLTGNGDGSHRSVWFDLEESPCPETGERQ